MNSLLNVMHRITGKDQEREESPTVFPWWNDSGGFALVAALLLIIMVGVAGVTVLQTTSTEVKISGNHRMEVQRLYWAEAGLAEARRRLRGIPSPGQPFIGDPFPGFNAYWSAYILTSGTWSSSQDRTFRSHYTNYIPTSVSQTNTTVLANALSPSLEFGVRIRHKTEFDAEQLGHRSSSPHYLDRDGSLKTHTMTHVGKVIYYGYPTLRAVRPVQFTSSTTPMGYPVELITAAGGNEGAGPVLEVEAIRLPGPKFLAALYAKGPVAVSGQPTHLSGLDACGVAPGAPPLYSNTSISLGTGIIVNGVPPKPVQGGLTIDLGEAIRELKVGAKVLSAGAVNGNFGNVNDYMTVFANAGAQEVLFRGVRGFGILLIQGDVVLKGPFEWNGILVTTGHVTLDGASGGIQVNGALWANQIESLTGSLNIAYHSCHIKAALFAKPLRIQWWREIF